MTGLERPREEGVTNGLKMGYNSEKEEKEEKEMNETFLKPKKRGRPSRCPDLDTLNLLYTTKTTTEIAELMDVPRETVRGWIKRARRNARAAEERTRAGV